MSCCARCGSRSTAACLSRSALLPTTPHHITNAQVFYAGDDELDPRASAHVASTVPDVTFRDIYQCAGAPRGVSFKGYQIKPMALLLSSFQEALWIDDDNVPLGDPAKCFDFHAYRDAGALFWPGAVAQSIV